MALAHRLPSPDMYRTEGSYFGVAPWHGPAMDWQLRYLADGALSLAAACAAQPARAPHRTSAPAAFLDFFKCG
jgi:hypothetical protein